MAIGSIPTPSAVVKRIDHTTDERQRKAMPPRKHAARERLTPPPDDVRKKQHAAHTEDDFMRDLDRASTDRATEGLAGPSERRRGSSKT